MLQHHKAVVLLLAITAGSLPILGELKKPQKKHDPKVEVTGSAAVVLWRNPVDLSTRDLFYGPGGKSHEPHGSMTFVEEDREGSNPKFVVRDADGVSWKAKLAEEVRCETAASRLIWAAGFTTHEDYYLDELRVSEMPERLHRGHKYVDHDGTVHKVRLKRDWQGMEKTGVWHWRNNPFHDTREMNGLRVMMALVNNWDLKDVNNAVYRQRKVPAKEDNVSDGAGTSKTEPEYESVYVVSDLGASFGNIGLGHPHFKDNLAAYSGSKFITHMTDDYVDFSTPGRPGLTVLINPHEYFTRVRMRWIGRRIPRADARWMGQILAQLSPNQIRDAFRAAGYSPQEIEGFASVVQNRIAELNRL
jgi:hypothetical protein